MHEARVTDELAIRALVAAYADAVNRRSSEDWAACWAPDGVWDLGAGRTVEGRDAAVALWTTLMAGFPFVVQIVHSGTVSVEPEGGAAAARWYLSEVFHRPDDGTSTLTYGVYHDRYVRLDEGWRFARRRYDTLLRAPLPEGAQVSPFPAVPAS